MAATFLLTGPSGLVAKAQAEESNQALEKEVQELKKKLTDVQDMLDEMDARVGDNEKHTVTDRLLWNVDLRTELNSLHYTDALVMPEFAQIMLGLWAFDKMATPLSDFGLPVTVLPGSTRPDHTFNGLFSQKYIGDLIPLMPLMLQGGFLSGIYLPMDIPDGPPAGTFLDPATAGGMFGTMSPEQLLGFFQAFGPVPVIANSATPAGAPLFGREFSKQALEMYMAMFRNIPAVKQDIDNDIITTTRLRLDLRSDATPHVSFGGRLSANKVWGDSTGVQWFNGSFDSIAMDGNVHQKGSDSAIRMERGFFTYRNDFDDVHWHFSVGRRPALGGAPWEVSTNAQVGASPMVHAINWQFDGASLGFDVSQVAKVEGMNFKICYGQGFESGAGSGNSYAMDYTSDLKDVNFLGYIFRLYDDGQTNITHMYARAFDVTDGFTGLTAIPFAINGLDYDNDSVYDTFTLSANTGGYISRFEPTANLGDMDLITLLLQTKYKGWDLFVDLAANIAHPDGRSQNAMMQFMGADAMLNSDGGQESHSGQSVWVGIKAPIAFTKGALGFEYNWGSKYWFGFNESEDTLGASKLATRGQVYELYYHQPIVGTKFLVSVGGQYYDYKYTGSGNPMGEPKEITEGINALDAIMPVPSEMWSAYLNMSYRW
jgi:hypothetical protein